MTVRTITGDCRTVLRTLATESVHCVVTSPPYFGLRDYGTAKWEGGEPGCDHAKGTAASLASTLKNDGRANFGSSEYEHSILRPYRSECGRCGARRVDSQIGLEPTPDAYVAELVGVFREIWRVLRKDGTCWLNLGDSYASGEIGRHDQKAGYYLTRPAAADAKKGSGEARQHAKLRTGLKPKDLVGIPWRVAFALQADGWWLRQDIIWAKPNPMPESVTDRCTKAHEYLFLLTKAARYYFDAAAIAEDAEARQQQRITSTAEQPKGPLRIAAGVQNGPQGGMSNTRNKRSVWTVATQPYSEAHFATFPPALIEPCILAGCPAKACAKCGAPWARDIEKDASPETQTDRQRHLTHVQVSRSGGIKSGGMKSTTFGLSASEMPRRTTLGFSPSCLCAADTIAGTVLDPFAGAGTTGLVADRLQRNAILIELNTDYGTMAKNRVYDDAPLFAEAAE